MTITIVIPRVSLNSRMKFMISVPVRLSRLPVGSSAKEVRLIDQGPRQSSPLLLAARKLTGAMRGASTRPTVPGPRCARSPLAAINLGEAEGQFNILQPTSCGKPG